MSGRTICSLFSKACADYNLRSQALCPTAREESGKCSVSKDIE